MRVFMGILNYFFKPRNHNSPDTLGVYPEYMQVRALPERRYLKTARILAIVILVNIAILVFIAGLYTYIADRADVAIANRSTVNLFTIDSSRKVIVPAEYSNKRVSAIELVTESLIRDYINNRHSVVWDNTIMQNRWDVGGPVARFSNYKNVYSPFRVEADSIFNDSRTNGFIRDVHLYELKRVNSTLWEGLFDTFDMPIPDSFSPICNCSDNSKKCVDCKVKNASRRMRFRVFIRTSFNNVKSLDNPLGFMISSYSTLYVPIHENENYWGIPSALKPDI